jgi:hypothetical protein
MARVRIQQDRAAAENRVQLSEYFSDHPCVVCGEADPVVLDFDHLRDKRWDVSFMVANGFVWSTIELEMAKCQVLCANCHARKTARELGIYERKHAFLRLSEERAPYYVSVQRMCPRCGLCKPLAEFGIRCRETGERQVWCRACMAEYKQGWYLRNREQHLARVRMNHDRITRENQDRAWEYLGQHPCVDCAEPDPVVLQFDHLRDKKWNVSYMLRGGFRWATIQAEIEKCEVRCANCHRRKTARAREAFARNPNEVNIKEPPAPYLWAIIENTRAVSSVDRAATF